jgi:putative ubiquitin-RnfH superfamily antitoxin RatB of RatAB toxin-antitoxin module
VSAARASKSCIVAWAGEQQQCQWQLTLGADACIADALSAARAAAAATGGAAHIPWDSAPVGIFGELRQRTDGFADGDRIELYRPLARDPRERRRDQVARERRAARGRS